MIRSLIRCSIAVVTVLAVVGCADVLPADPATATPLAVATAGPAEKGPADRALDGFMIEETIDTVDRARACRQGAGGGNGTDDRLHKGLVLTCPLIAGDRDAYFDIVDALKRDVAAIATIGGSISELGELAEPKSTILEIRGDAYRGSLSILGADGPGVLTIFVNLDLAIP